ncbi:MAG: type IX secretion system membrane protein PorP/SprF [Brumimicrobium sp.]|nr:type IX secretion system membrane protein PorP/SprF [Brumimicrobium sp.]
MSNPSFENIDRWFFEYSEGNLSGAQVEQLKNFVDKYPELKSEMEIWQEARLSKEDIPVFSADSYLKPVPFYAQNYIIVPTILLLIIGSFWIFSDLATQAKYEKSYSDIALISLEEDDFELNLSKSISAVNSVMSENKPTQIRNEVSKKGREENFQNSYRDDVVTNYGVGSESLLSEKNEKISTDIREANNLALKDNDFGSSDNAVIAEGLSSVVNYLNDNIILAESDMAETDLNNEVIDESASLNQSSFKRKLEKVFRKIKRMADQPIALKNTKDQYFHVPMMTGFNANFGMAGSVPGNRVQATSRLQWMNESNEQMLNTLSWDNYVYALRGGVGVDVSYNNYADNAIENFTAGLTYSPKFSVNKNVSLEPSLRFKMGVVNLDKNADILGSSIEMNRSNVKPLFVGSDTPTGSQLWYRDIGAGFLVNTKWFYVGINLDNIGRHYDNFYSSDNNNSLRADMHLTNVIGTEYQSLMKDIGVSTYLLHQKFGDLNELWVGSNFQWKWFQAGAAVNTDYGYAASAGIKLDKFSMHYNFDNTFSRLNDEKFISHQLTLKFLFKPSRYAVKYLNM